MRMYLIWLAGVLAWNYGFPAMPPLADVLAAIALSGLKPILHKLT